MTDIFIATAAGMTDLAPSPIPDSWIRSGSPRAHNRELARSHDGTSYTVVWDCTEGEFDWHYQKDEALVVLSGEVLITDQHGGQRWLRSGDLGFFPAGSRCTWQVKSRVRKVAVLRETMPRPLGFGLRACKKLLRLAGLAGSSPF
jgi:uncharacterized cupin superfamily protein